MQNVNEFTMAIVAALIVAFAVTTLGKLGGWLLLVVAIGLLLHAVNPSKFSFGGGGVFTGTGGGSSW